MIISLVTGMPPGVYPFLRTVSTHRPRFGKRRGGEAEKRRSEEKSQTKKEITLIRKFSILKRKYSILKRNN